MYHATNYVLTAFIEKATPDLSPHASLNPDSGIGRTVRLYSSNAIIPIGKDEYVLHVHTKWHSMTQLLMHLHSLI